MPREKLDVSYNFERYLLFQDVYGPTGLVVNSVGFILILFYSPPEIGAYKWFLLNYQLWGTVIDALFNFIQLEILFPLPGGRPIGYNSFLEFNQHFAMSMIIFLAGLSGAALFSCFVYRYNVLLAITNRGLSRRWIRYICVVAHIYIPFSVASLFAASYVSDDVSKKYILDNYPELEYLFTEERSDVDNTRMLMLVPSLNPMITVFLGYTTTLVFVLTVGASTLAALTLKTLHSMRTMMSAKTYSMHRSFTFTLIAQVIVPYSLFVIPITIILGIILLGINHSANFGLAMLCAVGTHASANTLIVIAMVKSYRKVSFDPICRTNFN